MLELQQADVQVSDDAELYVRLQLYLEGLQWLQPQENISIRPSVWGLTVGPSIYNYKWGLACGGHFPPFPQVVGETPGDQQCTSILHAMAQLPKRLCLAEKVATNKRRSFGVANVEILEEIWMNAYKGSWDIRRDKPSNFQIIAVIYINKTKHHIGSFAVFYIQKCLMFINFPIRTIWIHFFRTLPEVFSKSPGRDVRWIFTMTWDAWNFWEARKIRSPVS